MPDLNTVLRFTVAFVGLILSAYSVFVEIHMLYDVNYKAMCDINERISCTKVFSSYHGKGFGLVESILGKDSIFNLPNPVFGILFYTSAMILCSVPNNVFALRFLSFGAAVSSIVSIYLASILYKMNDICVVCISIYIVNFSLLYLNYKRLGETIVTLKQKIK